MSTDIYTYFTKPTGESELIFSAKTWVRITLVLETAGPVAVSTRQDVAPVLSGKGVLLEPDGEPLQFLLPLGDRLYVAAEAINRVKVIIEPLPWLEQVLQSLQGGFRSLLGVFKRKKSDPVEPETPPCPPELPLPRV